MTSALGSVASLAARAGGAVVDQVRSALGQGGGAGAASAPASGWLVVSIYREPSEIDVTALPAPLAAYGGSIETRVRPAPGGKGSELAVRLTGGSSGKASAPARLAGSDPQGDLRSALRQAKQLIEVGEVLAVDPTPHGKRTATPGGALLEAATKRAPKGGVL
ncbi:hypothetical protein DQ239_01520 [Blastococcus sp. TF02-09]|uniref:hypothetical protein n=1 Tax=Blastococcus sp. TF02-09 TaxID=2250576 RepID=UPI000DE8FA47|nr:hypothetical protein [Blastococcus sp. TF02-9]RBY81315.1 hypothetical protein DQ239_01520 [Blastococcus sp. TF02-9]